MCGLGTKTSRLFAKLKLPLLLPPFLGAHNFLLIAPLAFLLVTALKMRETRKIYRLWRLNQAKRPPPSPCTLAIGDWTRLSCGWKKTLSSK